MATLETIRNKAGILISVFIGLALVAFILTDLLSSGSSMFTGASNEIGTVDGNSISYEEYQYRLSQLEEWTKMQYQINSLDENTMNRLMDQNWDLIVRESIMGNQFEQLGISVTDKEMSLIFDQENTHPSIRQMFTDPQTGIYNQQMAIESYKGRNNNPQANFYWNYLLEQIKVEKLNLKYTDLISKGLYTTKSQLENRINYKQTTYNFDYILKPYTSITDSTIKVSDSEIKSFYNEHLDNYKSEPNREIKYVIFDIKPSEKDNSATKLRVEKAKTRMENPETEIVSFITRNSDNAPYIPKNEKFDNIKPILQEFVKTANVNDIYGPYFEDNAYKLTKLVAIKELPDSVKARHILIRTETPNSNKIADSLLTLAKDGADFAELARENSADQGSAVNGGDLGWFSEDKMVKPFSDACFEGNIGDIIKVQSQLGYHIIHLQDKGNTTQKYELATFSKNVLASQETRQEIYSTVTKFATENETADKFNNAITEQNLQSRMGYNIKINDRQLGNLESPRQLIKWAFDASLNETSPIFELGNNFVIALLTQIQDEEYLPVTKVADQIKTELLKDKKAEIIIKELNATIKESSSLSSVAQKANVQVKTASGVTFANPQVSGLGFAPALVGAVSKLEQNKISNPVKGLNGVYVLKLTSTGKSTVNAKTEKEAITQEMTYKVYRAFDAIKKGIEIEDNRYNFY
ncbi:MAG: peptidylprolyl isomerase [Marinilabiliaceae bacterium]|nr:peptidylprolyl isomerase [Marinilabiliaceae bacterium]